MKRIYLSILIVLLSLSATQAQTAPVQLNNDIAQITDSLFAQGKKWGAAFNEAYKDGSYSSLKPINDALLVFIDKKNKYVQNLKDVKNSKPLRMSMLDFLGFEKEMLVQTFRPFEQFDATTPKEKVQAAVTALIEKSKAEEDFLKKLTAAQETYATENGFTIETKQ